MADFNFDTQRRELIPAGTWGNLQIASGNYTAATTEVTTDRVALAKLPANCKVYGFMHQFGEVGVGTTLDLGLQPVDGSAATATTFLTAQADGASSTTFVPLAVPVSITKESYVIATVGGANMTVAGDLDVVFLYRYDNA